MRRLTLCSLVILTAVPVFADCDLTANRQASLSAAGAARVKVIARAGSLRVEGAGGQAVNATGVACATSKALLERTTLSVTREGDTIIVEAITPDADEHFIESMFGINDYARLDMKVVLPQNLPVYVKDGSGETVIRNVASLQLTDGSGEAHIRDVAGPVTVKDGSGELTIHGARGPVKITDGSGSIELSDIGSDVTIEADGSGSIEARDIRGGFMVELDGSGSIAANGIAGDFQVRHDGSGGIEFHNVRGRVRIPKD